MIASPNADVVYIDFDGVLHHEAVYWQHKRGVYMHPVEGRGHSLFEWTHYLCDVLEPFPTVRLVLSSTWCVYPGYGKALKRLPDDLRARFVGGTFHRRVHRAEPWMLESFKAKSRAQQILSDVHRRRPRSWLALDDDIDDWPKEHLQNLVACDGNIGLSNPAVRAELTCKLTAITKANQAAEIDGLDLPRERGIPL